MTFIQEVFTSLSEAIEKVEETATFVQQAQAAAQAAEHSLSLALAGAEQLGGHAQQTGIEDDIERARLLDTEIREAQEYASQLAGEWETKGEVAEGTKQKIEAIQQFVAEMGGIS
jgi:hypothetical protein